MRTLKTSLALAVSLFFLVAGQLAAAQGNSGNAGPPDHAGNSNGNGKALGKGKNIGVGNSSDGINGRIITAKDIFYTGDPLSISLKFTQGADLISSGEAEAWVVIFSPTPEASASDDGADDTDTASDDSDTNNDSGTDSTDSGSDQGDSTDNSDTTDDSDDVPGSDDVLTDAIVLAVSDVAGEEESTLFDIDAVDVSALPAGTYQIGLVLTNPGGDPLNINDWYRGLLGLEHLIGLTVADEALAADSNGDGEVDNDADGDGFSDDTDADSGDESDDGSDSGSGSDTST